MPVIKLSATQRLISTTRTWEWQHLRIRKHRKTGEPIEEWDFFRNYTSLESALTDVVNVGIRVSKHEDILEAVQEVNNAMASVSKALTHPIMEVVKAITEKVEAIHEH
jgi:hypothetical protein